MLPVLGPLESLERAESCVCLGPATGPWTACLLRRVYGCPRPPVVPASDDLGQFHLNAHHYQVQGFGRKPFSSPISRLHHGTLEEGTQAPVPGPLTSAHCCLPFPCVHPGTAFCQSLHPVTEGSKYRDPQPSTRLSSRSHLKRGNKNEEDGVRIMMGKSTETTGPSSWKLTNFRPTAVEPSWDSTTLCMQEKLGLFEGPLAVGSIPGA
ncbi:uncharacterized protein LOC131901077 isoform X2 [Peromyscus eremicus]|uniref:uncharacterized protein LOC131901077 isoform X2 n=1 Tax=Peromyscus eremicus TaxID=42410 RepID=UPI0027DD2D78|nr:uncharacterized protein LOC131901077 isoform X2 [Peromyscus eremicus]